MLYYKGANYPDKKQWEIDKSVVDGIHSGAIIIHTSEKDRDDILDILNGQVVHGLWGVWKYNDGNMGDKFLGGPVLEIMNDGTAKIGGGWGGSARKVNMFLSSKQGEALVDESAELLKVAHKTATKARQSHLVLFNALMKKFNLKKN